MWRGREWDEIGNFEAGEEYRDGWWNCRFDPVGARQQWKNREQLLVEHCFEPFLDWCSSHLVKARWLELLEYRGVTDARLFAERPSEKSSLKYIYGSNEASDCGLDAETHLVPVISNLAKFSLFPDVLAPTELRPGIMPGTHSRIPIV